MRRIVTGHNDNGKSVIKILPNCYQEKAEVSWEVYLGENQNRKQSRRK